MSSTDSTALRGIEMSDDEADEFLYERGHGVLSLARDDDAYGVPVSFGYDGDRAFVTLIRFGEESRKLDFSEHTDRACLAVYDVDDKFAWRSVLVTGGLDAVPDEETEYVENVMEDNAWFPNLFPPEEPITEVRRTQLRIDDVTGRQGKAYQPGFEQG